MGSVIQFPDKKNVTREFTFKEFAQAILEENIQNAASCLQVLFKVELQVALKCAVFYRSKLKEDPSLIYQTMEMREALDKNETNEILFLLQTCFGTSALEAMQILPALSEQFKKKNGQE